MDWLCAHCSYGCETLQGVEFHQKSCGHRKIIECKVCGTMLNKGDAFEHIQRCVIAQSTNINKKEAEAREQKEKETECPIPHVKDYSCCFCPPEKIEENIRDIQKKVMKETERKAPLHPGKIYHDIIISKDDSSSPTFSLHHEAYILRVDKDELFDFIKGKKDLDHVLAYKLAYNIGETDIRFWIDLQERYDEYMRGN